ncbi:MAG TPA: hypothetical protein VGF30_09825, partial [Bacteroidia bacterium]
ASKSTYLYLPPEAINENKYYFQSDLYQIGIILFQLLGGTFPLNEQETWLTEKEKKDWEKQRNADDQNLFLEKTLGKKICKGKLIDLSTLPEYLDDAYKRVISKALNPNHNKRYHNSSEFLKAIYNLMNTCPSYLQAKDYLLVCHASSKKDFKIYQDKKGNLILEKRINNKDWRKENTHNGTLESILKIARQK